MSQVDYVYVWADGIHVNIRVEENKLYLLVLIGVRATAARSWSRSLMATGSRPSRGPTCSAMRNAAACAPWCSPSVTGALGFSGALREVFTDTAEQRCWFHKSANVLAALPKSAHPAAKKALAEI